MKPLNLLIVAIRTEWLGLLEDSLSYAGYRFQMKQVDSKQAAIKAFHEAKYDLLISNCQLPDGNITDLADVLGTQLPCLVMSEGQCPVTAGKVLIVEDTNYYINCSDKLSWIPALENTLAKWRSNAQQKIDQHLQSNESLHKKILARSREIILGSKESDQNTDPLRTIFDLLLDIMDLSRVYLCVASHQPNGDLEIVKTKEVIAPGVSLRHSFTQNPIEIPFFKRWSKAFEAHKPVVEIASALTGQEKQWFAKYEIQSLAAVPIYLSGKWVAYIALEDTMNAREWSMPEIEMLTSLAALIQTEYHPNKSSRLDPARLTSPA
jgi:CheY-like chemotaxis protein